MTTLTSKTAPVLLLLLIGAAAASAFFLGPLAPAGLAGAVMLVVIGRAVTMSRGGPRPLTRSVVVMEPIEELARPLWPWVVGAIAIRWVAVIVLNASPLWMQFAPDAVYYKMAGEAIQESWSSPAVDLTLWFGQSKAYFYQFLNAISLSLFGVSRYPLSFLNGVIATWAAWNFGLLAKRMYGVHAQRVTFMLSAFLPSVIIWTSMNIRESWAYLALSITLLGADRLRRQVSPSAVILTLTGLALLAVIRTYLVPIVGAGIVLSFVVVRARQLPYAALGLIAVLGAFALFGDALGINRFLGDASLERVNLMRHQLAFGGSAYGGDVDTSTAFGAVKYLPLGILRFLLAPFPWNISSWRQLIALPESIVFAYVLYHGVREAIRSGWQETSKGALLIFVLVVTTCAYGLASGNEGTAFRHRGQVVFMVFVLAAGAFSRRVSERRWTAESST